jgi:hypothetical protein
MISLTIENLTFITRTPARELSAIDIKIPVQGPERGGPASDRAVT